MQKTLAQHMKPDAFDRKHLSEAQKQEKQLRVLFDDSSKWSHSNVGSIGYISELLVDLANGHGTIAEIRDEVERFETLLTNQRNQLTEAAKIYT
ncbi:hypothetical protein [Asticcacaulis sp.]|uniref:hypothetical protein n=1 Tax=Asticcacaulis sp. TaxID=1872648 RepID=UPI00391A7315